MTDYSCRERVEHDQLAPSLGLSAGSLHRTRLRLRHCAALVCNCRSRFWCRSALQAFPELSAPPWPRWAHPGEARLRGASSRPAHGDGERHGQRQVQPRTSTRAAVNGSPAGPTTRVPSDWTDECGDIFRATRATRGAAFDAPAAVDELNSPGSDGGVMLTPDGLRSSSFERCAPAPERSHCAGNVRTAPSAETIGSAKASRLREFV